MVYNYLDAQNIKEVHNYRKPSVRFRPSELDDCPRKIFYRLGGNLPMPVPGKISLYGQDGDISHDSVRWLMKNAGVELDGLEFDETTGAVRELVSFKKDWEHKGEHFVISGRSDGLVKVDDEWMILEIKSMDGMKWRYINEAWMKGNLMEYLMTGNHGKYRKFLVQCEVSMRVLGYKHVYLVFKDRSMCQIGCHHAKTGEITGIVLSRNDELWDDTLNTMSMVNKALHTNTPPMQLVEGSHQCGYCEFRDTCGRL
jgi:CRISPR/Cas system-associated exonuclease Cas4 (RecB family)